MVEAAIVGATLSLAGERGHSVADGRNADTNGSLESRPMASHQTVHLHPTAELAERVLLPGDPGRALALAQSLLEQPLMFNHNRGLWGYTGTAADGELLSVQSTGMGGPSAAIVLEELIALGVSRAIRVGTCGALDGALSLGEIVPAGEAIAADGASRALGAGERALADRQLTAALEAQCGRSGCTIVTTDLFYDPSPQRNQQWLGAGAMAVEMEAATLFTVGERAGIQVGCVLIVSDVHDSSGTRTRISPEDLEQAETRIGSLAAGALKAGAVR